MRTRQFITGLLLAGAFAAGCTRENEIIEPEPYPVSGKGGKIKLRVTPRHHLKNIDSCTVYIKYNSRNEPAKYDDSANVRYSDNRPMVIFDSLKKGDYYLYAKGYNFDINDTNQVVTGGAPFIVIDTLEKTYDLYLDVLDSKGK